MTGRVSVTATRSIADFDIQKKRENIANNITVLNLPTSAQRGKKFCVYVPACMCIQFSQFRNFAD